MTNLKFLFACLFLFLSCHTESPDNVELDSKIIDFHSHYRYPRDYLDTLFEKWNMQAVLVDVSIRDTSGISRRWKAQSDHYRLHPHRFYLCTSFEASEIDSKDFSQKTIKQLQQDIDSGAIMVKVWKNFGMVTQDTSGNFVQIDDSRLQPIWDFLIKRKIPVLAHIGEPIQAWRPLDDPKNPHYNYYKNHPEYHAYIHPEIPQWEKIINSRDRWIEKNAELVIIGAHLGSMSHDVDLVAERLDKYSNFHVETAARFGDLASQDSRKIRDFFIAYQDRILFGTDYGTSISQQMIEDPTLQHEEESLNNNYKRLFQYIETTDSLTIRNQQTIGLGLPDNVQQKFYYENGMRLLQKIDK